MKHNKKGEQEKRRLIAISIIKNLIRKEEIKSAVEVATSNGISAKEFGKITKEVVTEAE